MTEDDTFDTLRKWDFSKLYPIYNNMVHSSGKFSQEIFDYMWAEWMKKLRIAGWTHEEFFNEYIKRSMEGQFKNK